MITWLHIVLLLAAGAASPMKLISQREKKETEDGTVSLLQNITLMSDLSVTSSVIETIEHSVQQFETEIPESNNDSNFSSRSTDAYNISREIISSGAFMVPAPPDILENNTIPEKVKTDIHEYQMGNRTHSNSNKYQTMDDYKKRTSYEIDSDIYNVNVLLTNKTFGNTGTIEGNIPARSDVSNGNILTNKKFWNRGTTESNNPTGSDLSNLNRLTNEKFGDAGSGSKNFNQEMFMTDEDLSDTDNDGIDHDNGDDHSSNYYNIIRIAQEVIEGQTNSSEFDEPLRLPPTAEENERIQRFDPSNLNYTVIRQLINEIKGSNSTAQGRSFSDGLPGFLGKLSQALQMRTVMTEIETSVLTSVSCNACRAGVGLLRHYIVQGSSTEALVAAATKLCTSFVLESPRVCLGTIKLMKDELSEVLRGLVMETDSICGFVIGDVCDIPLDPYHHWHVLIPPYPKPVVTGDTMPKEDMPTLKVLHLSDTHFDPYYLEGSNADCNEPMCCRQTSGKPASKEAMAGKWGDYRKCDTPERTIRSMFQNIAQQHPDIDYIIWTGDLPPHDIWNQTRASNVQILRETVHQLSTYFPRTPVYPALGNHESAPVNNFPPPSMPSKFSVQWLYQELSKQWSRWLPLSAVRTILKGGYYAVQVAPGFRIISLNMNFCNNRNWWLLLDSEDPADELQWLVYELQASELKNEKVHIIGHIPPGYHDCLRVWSHNFYTIVNRYESTVTAQFYGHTHYDEFELFYDYSEKNDTYRATNVAYIGPSVTSYIGLNPGYRIYHVEAHVHSHRRVLDHETWIMKLDEANHPHNSTRSPHWYRLYSAREAYGMQSLLPVHWDDLVYRMVDDDALFDTFYNHYWKGSPVLEWCDADCKDRVVCMLRSGENSERQHTCRAVQRQHEEARHTTWSDWLMSGVTVTSLATLFLVL